MDKVNVIWASYHKPEILARGYWDQGLLEEMFAVGNYEHHSDFDYFKDLEIKQGAIVIVNGRTHTRDTEAINTDIAHLKWCLFIDTGDEEALFPWRDVHHPLMRVWVMLPRMNQHDDVSFHIPNGYRPQTKELLDMMPIPDEREYDFFFAGQVTHARREQCVEAARELSNGVIIETHSFGEAAITYPEYLSYLTHSKIALCPSGPETPDTFRVWEALEAGCVPIVDQFATNNQSPGFWQYLLKENPPFPIVSYWDKLPELLPELLKEYPENANRCFAWWQQYKRKLKFRLEDDVKELNR